MSHDPVVGCLLGTAVGDAIGLPYEGLSRRRGVRLLGTPDRHRLFFGGGMVSDDTEHACIVAQALISSAADPTHFRRSLSWRLRLWLLSIPAGVGLATLRSILRLWCGISPDRSGVFSAGNGPAMRAAVLGASMGDRQRLRELVKISSRITHTDPKAELGAYAVALAANCVTTNPSISADEYVHDLRDDLGGDGDELIKLIEQAAESVLRGDSTQSFADSLGLEKGVTGYVYHTVPIAIQVWFRNPRDLRSAIIEVIECGGDTDSVAAIVGGIIGTAVGEEGIPAEWLRGLREWPRSSKWLVQLGQQLSRVRNTHERERPAGLPIWGILPRNFFFLLVVLYHGFRRLFPPYA